MSESLSMIPTSEEQADLERFVLGVASRATDSGGADLGLVLPLVYDEFRSLAAAFLRREKAGHTLRPTALAHEAYLRLARDGARGPRNRAHLLALGATMMRRVLVDHARARHAERRGGRMERVSLDAALEAPAPTASVDLPELDDALAKLRALEERKAQVVELLYFVGLTFEEAGEVLAVSSRTVVRDWRFARAWLWRELGGGGAPEEES